MEYAQLRAGRWILGRDRRCHAQDQHIGFETALVNMKRLYNVYPPPDQGLSTLLVVVSEGDVKQQHDSKDTDEENVASQPQGTQPPD